MEGLSEEARQKVVGLEEENRRLEAGIEPLYTAIGRNYYEKPEGYEKEMELAADQLDAIKRKMHENHMEVLALKGIRLCPNCESEVEQGAIFCGECGIRIEAVKEVDENSVLCSRCGAKNEKGKKFCVICGQKLIDIIKAAQEESGQDMKGEDETLDEADSSETGLFQEAAENMEMPENTEGAENAKAAENADVLQEDVIFCPNCGNKLPADALFCGECGIRIAEEMPQEVSEAVPQGVPEEMPLFCTECGTKLSPGTAFCTECGMPVQAVR